METHSETAVTELDKIAVDITVNGEEKRLIELFRGLNQLGKAYIFDWLDTIAPLPKYSGKGLNIYKKRSVQQ